MSKTNVGVGVHTTSVSTTKMGVATALLGAAAIAAAAAGGLSSTFCTASTVTAVSGGQVAVCRGETLVASDDNGETLAVQILRYSNTVLVLSLQATTGGKKQATLNKDVVYLISAFDINGFGAVTYLGVNDEKKAVLLVEAPTLPPEPPSPPLEEVPIANCTDGIQNQDETGVDCGGASCPACAEAPVSVLPPEAIPPSGCVFIKGSLEQLESKGTACTFKECTGGIDWEENPDSKWKQIPGKSTDNFSLYCLKRTCQGVGAAETFQCKVFQEE